MARTHRLPRHRCSGRGLAMALVVSALISGIVALMWQLAVPSTTAPASSHAWLAMLAFGAACAGAGLAWGHQRSAARLREARLRQQLATQLINAWLWETDSQHRLRQWRPPPGATNAAWADARPLTTALWDQFDLGDPNGAALKARLDAQAPIEALRVRRQGEAQPWLLRAHPRFDDEGSFAGYLGSAHPLGDDEQGRFAQTLLAKLWPELDVPALALRPSGPAGDPESSWEVTALSPDAARLLKLGPQDGLLSWADARSRLPPPLGQAVAHLQPGQTREEGGWTLHLQSVGDDSTPAGGRLLLLRPKAAEEPVDAGAAEDQASFAYSVSHDLRAPIRVVEGFTRILKEDYGRFLDRIGNDHLERVLAAAARMNSMIDALLALSRLQQQPLSRKPVDLSQLATYIVEDLKREHPERMAEVTIEPGMLVQGDPTLLRIALENLLGNAWKYSSQTPLTKIEFRHDTHQGQRVMMVADNGAGFDMRFADRLFGVFQRLHSANDFQGTGVGLASVRRIIRRHGGDIWAEAEVGKGARFYFTLG
ncbi:MAG TPA: ATP-binding protein [Ideonella sp.]|uniref:sensor histidine kinase n=1 Tax=Ideonella sp. TaxID=1929293 RepID=UPI002E342D87|nr:ATP-binding protein [Ideonella sp.]HEX5685351.1 ATP-binding protein [Ideonella sp.]